MDGTQAGTLQNQQYILIAFVLNVGVQLFREWRNHKWQQDEVKRQEKAAAELANKVVEEKEEHKQFVTTKLNEQTAELKEEINNTVLKRLVQLGQRFDTILSEDDSDPKRRTTDK